jgi:hypothetical protein
VTGHDRILAHIATLDLLLEAGPCPQASGMRAGLRLAVRELEAEAPRQPNPIQAPIRQPDPPAAPFPLPPPPPVVARPLTPLPPAAPPNKRSKAAADRWARWREREAAEARGEDLPDIATVTPARAPRVTTPKPAAPPAAALWPAEQAEIADRALAEKHARVRVLLIEGKEEHLIAAECRIPLREVMRLRAELREDMRRGVAP